jgi:hypothetical protein
LLFRGLITVEQLEWSEAQAAEFINAFAQQAACAA